MTVERVVYPMIQSRARRGILLGQRVELECPLRQINNAESGAMESLAQ
jgi:hypothetical protein